VLCIESGAVLSCQDLVVQVLPPQWVLSPVFGTAECSGSAHAKITETYIRCHASIRELYPSICQTTKASEITLGGLRFVLNLAPCYLARTLWSKYCCRSGS
jgi:hypothetical protein